MVTILIMSPKWAALGLPKLKEFCNKGYDITNYIYDVTIKIISRDSNYILDVVTWPKFGSSSITRREVIINSSWPEKTFFWEIFLVQVQYGLQTLRHCSKKVKTKSQKVLETNSYVCRSYKGKIGKARGVGVVGANRLNDYRLYFIAQIILCRIKYPLCQLDNVKK